MSFASTLVLNLIVFEVPAALEKGPLKGTVPAVIKSCTSLKMIIQLNEQLSASTENHRERDSLLPQRSETIVNRSFPNIQIR